MSDEELARKIDALFSAPPGVHTDFDGNLLAWGIDLRLIPVIRDFVRPGQATIETGAGLSTILFLLLGAVHRAITPDAREVGHVLAYCDAHDIATTGFHPIVGPSERVVPALDPALTFDFALIDGNHAFPAPFIDWYYVTDRLRDGGVIAVDDLPLWPCRILADFLDEEEGWQRVTRNDRFAVYRMTAPRREVLGRWWGQQRYVVRRSPGAAGDAAVEPDPPPPAAPETAVPTPPTAPAAPSPRSVRPRVTVAVPFAVYPPVGGGQQRVFALYRHVARDFDVELVTLADRDVQFSDQEIAPGLREIRIPKTARHQEAETRLTAEAGGIPVGDIGLARFLDDTPEYGETLARSIGKAAVVVASHPYALPAIRPALAGRPLVYEAHNVEYLLKKAMLGGAGPTGAELAEIVRQLEADACRAGDLILCCSARDRDDLCALYGVAAERIVIAPNGVDTRGIPFTPRADREALKRRVGVGGRAVLLFVGSWHQPNLEAAGALFEMAADMPDVTFLLAGSQSLPLAGRPRPANVGLMGVVDDETLAMLLALGDIALNPMLSGSGSNLKLATYLAAGIPVITTALGARGYDLVDGDTAVICGVDEFSAAIRRVLGDAELAADLARRGRRLVEDRYDWEKVASGVRSALHALAPATGGPSDPGAGLIDEVSAAIVELGIPDALAPIGPVALAMTEMGLARRPPGSAPPGAR